jgi:hypothetical protein
VLVTLALLSLRVMLMPEVVFVRSARQQSVA